MGVAKWRGPVRVEPHSETADGTVALVDADGRWVLRTHKGRADAIAAALNAAPAGCGCRELANLRAEMHLQMAKASSPAAAGEYQAAAFALERLAARLPAPPAAEVPGDWREVRAELQSRLAAAERERDRQRQIATAFGDQRDQLAERLDAAEQARDAALAEVARLTAEREAVRDALALLRREGGAA